MSTTVRATCPGCRQPLRIPAEMLGKSVRCKKCGTVVRSKAPSKAVAQPFSLDDPEPISQPAHAAGSPAIVSASYSYAPPAGYAAPEPLALDDDLPGAPHGYRGRGRYRRGGGPGKLVWIAFGVLLTAGLVAAGVFLPGYLKKKIGPTAPGTMVKAKAPSAAGSTPGTQATSAPSGGTTASSGGGTSGGIPVSTAPVPRRMLFIHVGNYLYLNPLTSAAPAGPSYGPDKIRAAAQQLAYEWQVPRAKDNNQLYFLSDSGAADARAPFKGVITDTLDKFLGGDRTQDHIFIYFGGHALEKDGKAYLVPIEGDPDDVETLIPLDDVYAKIAASPGQQKVVVWDVCRYNPERGRVRPGAEPMTEELEKKLSAAPPGVQAVLTCSAKQNALEFSNLRYGSDHVIGSSFLAAASFLAKGNKTAKSLSPTDPLPVKEWVEAIGKRVAEVAEASPLGEDKVRLPQTPKLYGEMKGEPVAYDPKEPFPARFELPTPPAGASPTQIASVAEEIKLPPIKPDFKEQTLDRFPFPGDALKDFGTEVTATQIMGDKKKYKFEAAVLDAYASIRKIWGGQTGAESLTKYTELRTTFPADVQEKDKKLIREYQNYPAIAILELEEIVASLNAVAAKRDAQPKRWQADYDYVFAQAKARLAFMNEYNLLLGKTLTPEVLPPLDKAKARHVGWKLISTEKMQSKKDVKQMADDAKELFAKIIETYKGTPWAVQAKRDKTLSLGLEWQPYAEGSAPTD